MIIRDGYIKNITCSFEITDGDITTRIGINPINIAAKVRDIVKKHSVRVFKQSDYLEVVHLIGMDGAFFRMKM